VDPDTNPRTDDRAGTTGAGSSTPPPGLRARIDAAIAAVRRLLTAHVELAKAELGEIVDEVKKMVALIGAAIGLLVMLGLLLSVGLVLWIGEWWFGSIGWGLLLGGLFYLDLAVTIVLVALGVGAGRLGAPMAVAALVGLAVAVALGIATGLGWQVSIALGAFVGLAGWLVADGIALRDGGIDGEALKARFIPDQTIETTKETIEWVRERTPLGRRS
jgi:hypothetical protein